MMRSITFGLRLLVKDLMLHFGNGPEFKPYECLFVPDSFQLTSIQGPVYTVTAQLRVAYCRFELNKIIVETGNGGEDLASLFNPLENW
ncbi:hypothetical protein [Acinetobacter baumannii]|uniref:hypothetical protein n=1 Tax=Acinetobacter baumannii TaxID=470 RepID=UPI001D197428|nr:hypothetical protein [Acinetobacter baumannii]